jgi:hypothetical protein
VIFALGLPGRGFAKAEQYSYEVENVSVNS